MTAADPRDGIQLRTPDGWLIRHEDGGKISVMAPNACPGMTFVSPDEETLEGRLLYALAETLLAHARPEAVDYKAALQAAVDGIEVPKMTAARAEYYKAGARAAIAAMNAALTPERAP